jgi:hypothetical protein
VHNTTFNKEKQLCMGLLQGYTEFTETLQKSISELLTTTLSFSPCSCTWDRHEGARKHLHGHAERKNFADADADEMTHWRRDAIS